MIKSEFTISVLLIGLIFFKAFNLENKETKRIDFIELHKPVI